MGTLFRCAALALVGGTLLLGGTAAPAFADDDGRHWRKHQGWRHDHGHRWDRDDRRWDRRDRHWDRRHHHHHHRGRDVYVYERKRGGDTGLAFGLGAITGLAAGALLAAPPAYAAPPPPVTYYTPPPPVTYGQQSPIYAAPTGRQSADGHCREYQTQVRVNGRLEPAYGTACLQPDGSWRTVD